MEWEKLWELFYCAVLAAQNLFDLSILRVFVTYWVCSILFFIFLRKETLVTHSVGDFSLINVARR